MDWVAAALSLAAIVITGRKHWFGWAFSFAGAVLWVIIAHRQSLFGMMAVNAILAGLCVWNGVAWFRSRP